LASAVVVLLIALAAGSTAAAVRIAGEQVLTRKERSSAIAARDRADRSATAAREHFSLALNTLNNMVYDVQNQLVERPGNLELRRRILESARSGLERISAQRRGDTQHR